MKRFLLFTLVIGLFAVQANAAMYLKLYDAGNSVTIMDGPGTGGDGTLDGIITFSGSLNSTPGSTVWTVNTTTAISKPILGTLGAVGVTHLDSVNVSSSGGGTLWVEMTDTDFDLTSLPVSVGTMTSGYSATTDGDIHFTQTLDPDNVEWGNGDTDDVSVSTGWLYGPGSFSGEQEIAVPLDSIFSLTEKAIIVHTGGGQVTSFDFESTVVPVPAAVILGVLGLGVAGIKLRKYA